ncbi:MAG TPA: hypothetical protein VF443_07910 [Nitrospira sp.]
MGTFHPLVGRIMIAGVMAGVFSGGLPVGLRTAHASEPTLQERGDALMKNVEEMMAHGGMGDAKAIVHHCGEAAGYAEAILKQLADSDPRRSQALAPLTDVIHHCKRVSDTGIHADPGQLLNPAIKARAAARASIKALGLVKTN